MYQPHSIRPSSSSSSSSFSSSYYQSERSPLIRSPLTLLQSGPTPAPSSTPNLPPHIPYHPCLTHTIPVIFALPLGPKRPHHYRNWWTSKSTTIRTTTRIRTITRTISMILVVQVDFPGKRRQTQIPCIQTQSPRPLFHKSPMKFLDLKHNLPSPPPRGWGVPPLLWIHYHTCIAISPSLYPQPDNLIGRIAPF